MKWYLAIVVAAVVLNGVLALPARSPNDDAEIIDVPRKPAARGDDEFHDFKGVIDTGSGYPFLIPEPHPFSLSLGFFDTFEDIFRRLHSRLWPLELPGAGGDSSEDNSSGEATSLFNVDPKKANTTSTVKIVDGHKIEINDTVYGDKNSVFKVRVVNIRPLDSGEEAGEGATQQPAVTSVPHTTSVPDTSAPVTNVPLSSVPVTSGPKSPNENEASDERREPLEEKKPEENEIKANIDDPEVKH